MNTGQYSDASLDALQVAGVMRQERYSLSQVAKIIGVSLPTARNLANSGAFRSIRVSSHRCFVMAKDLATYIDKSVTLAR